MPSLTTQKILFADLSSQTLTMASNSFGILENPFEHLQKLILFIGTSWNKRLEVQLLQHEWMNFSTLMGSERDQAQLFALSGKSKTLFKLLWIVIKKVISIKIRGLELSTIWILIKRLSHYVGNSEGWNANDDTCRMWREGTPVFKMEENITGISKQKNFLEIHFLSRETRKDFSRWNEDKLSRFEENGRQNYGHIKTHFCENTLSFFD